MVTERQSPRIVHENGTTACMHNIPYGKNELCVVHVSDGRKKKTGERDVSETENARERKREREMDRGRKQKCGQRRKARGSPDVSRSALKPRLKQRVPPAN